MERLPLQRNPVLLHCAALRLQLELQPAADASRAQCLRALADAYVSTGQHLKAVRQLQSLLSDTGLSKPQRLELLCQLADLQLKLDEARGAAEVEAQMAAAATGAAAGGGGEGASQLQPAPPMRTVSMTRLDVLAQQAAEDEVSQEQPTSKTLLEIVALAPHAERYSKYQDAWLKCLLLTIFSAPPRSVERQQHRLQALRACRDLVFRGGCSPLPYEAAVWLLEEEEEIKGGLASVGGQVRRAQGLGRDWGRWKGAQAACGTHWQVDHCMGCLFVCSA